MCNPCSITKGKQAIRAFARAMADQAGNLPPQPGVFPDHLAPVLRSQPEGRELATPRWGMP